MSGTASKKERPGQKISEMSHWASDIRSYQLGVFEALPTSLLVILRLVFVCTAFVNPVPLAVSLYISETTKKFDCT